MVWLLSLSKVHGKKVGSNLIHEPKAEENLIGKKWKWSRSVMSNSVTKWTVAHQAPLSKGFSRQEYCVGCHSLLQGIFPPRDGTWVSRIAGKCFTLWATREGPIPLYPFAIILLYISIYLYSWDGLCLYGGNTIQWGTTANVLKSAVVGVSTKKVSKGYRPELLSTSTLRATCGTLAHRPPVPLEGPGWHQNVLCIWSKPFFFSN